MKLKKIILSIFLVSLIFGFGLYYFRELVITAWVAYVQGPMGATVAETIINASLYLSVDKSTYYCPGETVNLTNAIRNIGNKDITGDLQTIILNPSSVVVNTTSWYSISLSPSQVKYYNAYYTVPTDPSTGSYNANSNFTYVEKFEYASDTFTIYKGLGNFLYSPYSTIEKTIEPGDFDDTTAIEIWLQYSCENTVITINKSSGIPGDWTNFSNEKLFLSTYNSTVVNITVPIDTIEGDYYGTISLSYTDIYGEHKHDIDLIVHVRGLAFTLTVDAQPKQVCLGNIISAVVNTEKNREGPLDVNMTYQIVNSTNTLIENNRSLHFDNMTAQDVPTFDTSSLAEGVYIFQAILQYNQTQTQSSDSFQVIECIPTTTVTPSPQVGPSPAPTPTPSVTPTYGLNLRLSKNLLTVITGNKTSFIAFVNNTGTDIVRSVKISTEGIPLNWIETLPVTSDISPKQVKEYLVVINVPSNIETGVYNLKVKASDNIESNTETLSLIVGKNSKEIADLLQIELEKIRKSANQSLSVEECIDISLIKSLYQDAEISRESGLKEYKAENYVDTINWFEYTILNYQQVISKVELTIQLEIYTTKKSSLFVPPGNNVENLLNQAQNNLNEKNYDKICEYLINTRTLIMYGFIFWPILIIIPIIMIIVFVIIHQKQREIGRDKTFEKIKERLQGASEINKPVHIYPRYISFERIKKLLTKEKKK